MKTTIAALTCLGFLGAASVARADPLVITSGALSYDSDFGCCVAQLNLSAGGIDISQFVFTEPILGSAGTLIPPGAAVPFGVHVTSFVQQSFGVQAQGDLQFVAAPIALQDFGSTFSRLTFTTPFTMTGNLNAVSGASIFSGEVGGSGLLTLLLQSGQRNGTSGFFLEDATFTFAAPTATPEPATLMLVGGGLAAFLVRRKRRVIE